MAKRIQEEKNEFVAKSKSTAMNLPSHVPTSSSSAKSRIASKSPRILIAMEKPEGTRRRNSKSDAASSSQARLQDAYLGGLMDTATEKPVATKEESGDVDLSESETGSEEDVTGRPVAFPLRKLFQDTMPRLCFILANWHRILFMWKKSQPLAKDQTVRQEELRRLISSRLRHQKDRTHGAIHGTSERQRMHFKAKEMLQKVRQHKHGGSKTILERLHKDDDYRKSLSDIGWTEEQIIQYDEVALEDHSYMATPKNSQRENWFLSLNQEGVQGPMNQRPDFVEAKRKYKRLHDEHVKETSEGNTPIHSTQRTIQQRDQQFEGLEECDYQVFDPV